MTKGLKIFFDEILELYDRFYSKTFALNLFTVIYSGLITGVLFFLNANPAGFRNQKDFFSFYFTSASSRGTYSLTDLSMIFFLALTAFFAIALRRIQDKDIKMTYISMFQQLKLIDFGNVLIALATAGIGDFVISSLLHLNFGLPELQPLILFFKRFLDLIRSMIPLILFAIVVSRAVSVNTLRINGKLIPVFLAAAFIYYLFCVEVFSWFRFLICSTITDIIPNHDTAYLINVFLCIPVFAFFIPGFSAVMYLPGLLAKNGFAVIIPGKTQDGTREENDENLSDSEPENDTDLI